MSIEHVSADALCENVFEVLQRDGCVVIDDLIDPDTVAGIRSEMAPHLNTSPKGTDDFDGFETRRAGTLIARSPSSRDVIMNRLVLETARKALAHANKFQLHCTQMISIGPGEKPQPIHRDQWAFDMFPFPKGHDSTFATMWALTDFTEENGATRVVPSSHKLDDNKLQFEMEATVPAEMRAGSVLLYTGSLYHGGGANRTDAVRDGLIVHYSLAWLRQEENQFLCVPQSVLQELPEDLLRLMGYDRANFSLGFIDGGRDPMAAVRPEFEMGDEPLGLEQMAHAIENQA